MPLFLFLLFFFTFLSASPCSPEKIKEELIKMKIDPDIETNKELVNHMGYIYGHEFENEILKMHPFFIENPLALVDQKTIMWLNEVIWNPKNPRFRYIYIPGDFSSQVQVDLLVTNMMGALISKRRVIPIFENESGRSIYLSLLESKNLYLVEEIMSRKYFHVIDEELKKVAIEFQNHYKKYNDSKIGFDFSLNEKAVIMLNGHGSAGNYTYFYGDTVISGSEIVKKLVDMKLPKNSIIKLTGCFTACTLNISTLSIEQIKKSFLNGDLYQIYYDDKNESFLQQFYYELKKQMPGFCGRVDGYVGAISDQLVSNVLTKKGQLTTAFAAKVQGSDGTLLLKREDARFSFYPLDACFESAS